MDHFQKIYTTQAKDYHQLIVPEDVDGNLLPALLKVAPLKNATLLDLGSGTGRIPLLVQDLVAQVIALDLNFPMLQEQQVQRAKVGAHWPLVNGDNRALPFPDDWADVITAGWALGHLRGWYPEDWQIQIGKILREMERVALPGGTLIIMETLTTGATEPAPPTTELAEYYTWLEEDWGYTRLEIQTDYQFDSVEQAVAKTQFFFGPEMAELIRQNQWARLPEWTGLWFKRV
jgi:ubiquinone/menaquinone biosynthesis C-methylase UbiE